MTEQGVQFLYGDRQLSLTAQALVDSEVDALVIPVDTGLQVIGADGSAVHARAGSGLSDDCRRLIREYGEYEPGMAVQSGAGALPQRAVLHVVMADADTDHAREALGASVAMAMQLCELNGWRSLAMPGFHGLLPSLSVDDCAAVLFHVITHFWDARFDTSLVSVSLHPGEDGLPGYLAAFRLAGSDAAEGDTPQPPADDERQTVGHLSLDEAEVSAPDADIDDWFR